MVDRSGAAQPARRPDRAEPCPGQRRRCGVAELLPARDRHRCGGERCLAGHGRTDSAAPPHSRRRRRPRAPRVSLSAAWLPIPVVLPIAGATVAPLLGRISSRAPLVVSLLAMAGTTGVLLLFAPAVYGGRLLSHALGKIGPIDGKQLGIMMSADAFGLTYALLTAILGGLILLYSLSELGGLGAREAGAYACLVQLLLAALIGSALT